jgi:hypothetical protein
MVVCVCLLLDTFYQCPEMSVFMDSCNSSILGDENVLVGFCLCVVVKVGTSVINGLFCM